MRCLFVLLTLLAGTGCDKLWIPYCQDQPNDPSCFFTYKVAPGWIATGFRQSVILRSMLPSDNGPVLLRLNAQISAKSIHSQGDTQLEIQKIRSSGDIEVTLDGSDENPVSEIQLKFGSAEPISIPVRTVRLACVPQPNYQKNLGIINGTDAEQEVRWDGLRVNKVVSFFTDETDAMQSQNVTSPPVLKEWKLQTSNGAPSPLNADNVPYPDLRIDKKCKVLVTKNLAYQYCYLSNEGETALYGLSFENPVGAPTASCASEIGTKRKIICTKTSDPLMATAADEDVIAIADNQKLNILRISTQNQQNSIQNFVYPLDKKPDFLFFARVQSQSALPPESLLISLSLDGDVRIYGPASNGEYERRVGREQVLASAIAPLRALEIPIRAMAIGHLVDAQIPTLVVSQGTQLWLVPLDEALAGEWQAGRLPLGAAVRSSALPEPPVRLELGDLDGDGRQDIVAVGASAAYVCLTKPALE